MNPEMFSLGPISIRWYSFMILIGIIVAFVVATLEEKRKGFPKDFVIDLGFYLILFGILGARIYYVLFNLDYYLANPSQIIAVWNGGLAIHGGIIAGAITLIVFCLKRKINILKTMDLVVPSLIIAQGIGRWGNFFNGEAHGPLTTLKYLQDLHIPEFVIKGMKINGNYYIPTFYYEFLWCLAGFVVLMLLRYLWKKYNTGQLTGFYLLWYGIGRLCIESLRTDALMLGNIKIAQLISILFIVSGFVLLFLAIIIGLVRFIIDITKKKELKEEKTKMKKKKQG
jgi:phosphatidylglycerol:prolipoprotein diacylglycerol transferase